MSEPLTKEERLRLFEWATQFADVDIARNCLRYEATLQAAEAALVAYNKASGEAVADLKARLSAEQAAKERLRKVLDFTFGWLDNIVFQGVASREIAGISKFKPNPDMGLEDIRAELAASGPATEVAP